MYTCAECGVSVVVIPDREPVRLCGHDAPIIAEARVHMRGWSVVR